MNQTHATAVRRTQPIGNYAHFNAMNENALYLNLLSNEHLLFVLVATLQSL